ncbi:unnamed protein product (macronuclear) [Paramecium tetraurelia]|uniref:Uncharacterized protein n=1 Tax=Paramecium tetraurelia TaxID=5888 RepID=A0DBU1_PARTE|nr:uncharacterized protein GSPATT00039404001 [Paramecium tetraurelia]CAK80508.1 unnamed protein product [Paramecium tetraurelia]|eukprot:XP_001447905.1 hypothetical protein (macronuclear) [Paramecium tetraurelia strain d4-2]
MQSSLCSLNNLPKANGANNVQSDISSTEFTINDLRPNQLKHEVLLAEFKGVTKRFRNIQNQQQLKLKDLYYLSNEPLTLIAISNSKEGKLTNPTFVEFIKKPTTQSEKKFGPWNRNQQREELTDVVL